MGTMGSSGSESEALDLLIWMRAVDNVAKNGLLPHNKQILLLLLLLHDNDDDDDFEMFWIDLLALFSFSLILEL
ncbi:hypothetical protein Tco_1361428 [Tanacetum coccineum]